MSHTNITERRRHVSGFTFKHKGLKEAKMKYSGIKWMSESPFYVRWKKHFCPECNTQLGTIKVSRIVHSSSEEAKGFDFSVGGETYMYGNVKFIWTEFKCPKCGKQLTIDEMKRIESGMSKYEWDYKKEQNKKWGKWAFFITLVVFIYWLISSQ